MDCPNCGTWNPDDKQVCWRCQTTLPKPEPKKEKKSFTFFGLPGWLLILALILILMPVLGQCGGRLLSP